MLRKCLGTLVLAVIAAATTGGAGAQEAGAAPTPEHIAEGKQIWSDSGCSLCHGTKGQGGTNPDYPNGPSLRSADITRDGLVEAIACGRPGSPMAAWQQGAYTEMSCYGIEPGAIPSGAAVIGLYEQAQIEALADYIIASFWPD